MQLSNTLVNVTKGRFLENLMLLFLLMSGHLVIQTSAVAQPTAPDGASDLRELDTLGADPLVGETYILGVGDYLRVDVFNIPDYGGEFRVLSGGGVNIPIVGAVDVEGLSIQQATEHIENSLVPYVQRPVVTLSLLEARPIQIAVAGEVHRPGAYRVDVAGDANNSSTAELPTLTQAIELAGGITQLADIRQIEVQRHLPRSLSTGSSNPVLGDNRYARLPNSKTVSVNLWDLLKEGDLSEDLQLQDGDRILIPTASDLNSDEVAEEATASFSPDQISVNVVGEVEAPGAIQVPPNTPLNQAILAAGGFNNRARQGTVSLVRLNLNGTASQREIEVDFSQGIDEDTNPSLRPNDTVIVKRSGLARAGDTFGAVFSPLNFTLNILRLFGL